MRNAWLDYRTQLDGRLTVAAAPLARAEVPLSPEEMTLFQQGQARRLCALLLRQALSDYLLYPADHRPGAADDPVRRARWQRARDWLFDDRISGAAPFSIEVVASVLGGHVDSLRRHIRADPAQTQRQVCRLVLLLDRQERIDESDPYVSQPAGTEGDRDGREATPTLA